MSIIVQVCFDCGSPFPSWCSLNNGIFLCITCSGKHRGLGTHISFVRSLSLDKFRKDQIAYFKYGGNKNGREAFKNGFATKEANDYRNELKKNVCAEFKYFLSFFLPCFFFSLIPSNCILHFSSLFLIYIFYSLPYQPLPLPSPPPSLPSSSFSSSSSSSSSLSSPPVCPRRWCCGLL